MRWITEALQYARYKQPAAGLPIKKLVNLSEHSQKKISSTSSHLDCLPSPPPSPEARSQRRKAVSGMRILFIHQTKYLNSLLIITVLEFHFIKGVYFSNTC